MAHLSKKALVGNHTSLEYLDTWQLEVNRGNLVTVCYVYMCLVLSQCFKNPKKQGLENPRITQNASE